MLNDIEFFYPYQILSNFKLGLDFMLTLDTMNKKSLLGLNWAKREIEKQNTRIWKEFKAELEVF